MCCTYVLNVHVCVEVLLEKLYMVCETVVAKLKLIHEYQIDRQILV